MASRADILIREPIWGTRSIGVAEYKIRDKNYIKIDVKDQSGNKVYPGVYMATREQLMAGEVKWVGQTPRRVKLRVIPISQLTVVE